MTLSVPTSMKRVNHLSERLTVQLNKLIQQSLRDKIFPGIEVLFSRGKTILFHDSFGCVDKDPHSAALRVNSIFDLASLTKPLATTPAILRLMESGLLDLEQPLCSFFPEFSKPPKERVTIRHLLTHTSGLPSWIALYEPDFNRNRGWEKLIACDLTYHPGEKTVYSCLGFILLGELIRQLSGGTLTEYCDHQLYSPIGLENMGFNPNSPPEKLIPTAFCPFRKKRLRGVVHDENSGLFDGEGGNSGLFGTAIDIHLFCGTLLTRGKEGHTRILEPESVELMFTNQNPARLEPRTLGWDFHNGKSDYMSCGKLMPIGSVGHLGFTGTSLWLNPLTETMVILLSNRVNISREDNIPLMKSFRPKIHDLLLSHFPTTGQNS